MAATSNSMKFHKSLYQENPVNMMSTNPENNNTSTQNPNMNYTMQNSQNYKMGFSQQIPMTMNNMNSQERFYNNLYTNNTNPIFFNFKERSGKLKWKEIMRLDLENMIKSNDISSLETYLENLIFSDVNENDIEIITESTTVKLIKIYQHILEYLLHTQIRLENENKMLETNYSSVLSDSIMKETTLKENKGLISTLKKDKREKEMILNTYKCIIDEYKFTNGNFGNTLNGNGTINQQRTRRNPDKISKSVAPADIGEKKYYFCNFCSGKKFSTEEFLQSHISRRHPNINSNTLGSNHNDLNISDLRQSKKEYVKNLEYQVEELKDLFKNFMQHNNNINNDSLNKLADNQKILENKIVEVKSDKEKLLNVMEENFKTTLVEIKEFVKKNNTNNISQENFNGKNTPKDNKDINEINNNLSNINEIILELKNNQNKKIDNVYDEIKNFKSSISTEIRDIKMNNNTNSNQHNLNQNFQSFSDAKNFKLQTESVEIPKNLQNTTTNNPNENPLKSSKGNVNYLNANNPDKRVKNIKTIKENKNFNAGILESDDDNEIIEEYDMDKKPMISNSSYNKREFVERNKPKQNSKEKFKQQNPINENERERESDPQAEMQEEKMVKFNQEKKGNIFDKEKLKELNENEDHEQEDKLMDVSNFTKEKNEIKKTKEIKSNKKNDEHEIILDNNSQLITQNSKQKALHSNENETKKEETKEEIKEISVNEKEEINFKRKNQSEKDQKSQKSQKSKSVKPKENEIKINNIKNETCVNIEVKEENVENVRSQIMDQFNLREEMFKNADFNYQNIDLDEDKGMEGYKRIL